MEQIVVFVQRGKECPEGRKQTGDTLHDAGRTALREGLRRLYGITGEIRIGIEKGGKPFLADYPEIFFNISHSGELAVCAIAAMPVGVDVQNRKGIRSERIVERFFNEEDRNAYRTAKDRESTFCRLWTEIEAYGKWLGTGLSGTLGKPRKSGCGMHFPVGEEYEATVWAEREAEVVVCELE